MDNKTLANVNRENAEEICARIRMDAQAEAALVLERARAEAQKFIDAAVSSPHFYILTRPRPGLRSKNSPCSRAWMKTRRSSRTRSCRL